VKLLLVFLIATAGCRRAGSPPPGATAPPADAAHPLSRGFQHRVPPAEPPGEKTAPAGPTIPPELSSRPAPAAGFALYLDGKLQRTVPPAELADAVPLARLAGKARSALVHGETNAWLTRSELERMQLRTNRRGLVKVEPLRSGGHGGGGGGGEEDEHEQQQVRGVKWIELRSPESAKLYGEP
jgi:hypothetical protein